MIAPVPMMQTHNFVVQMHNNVMRTQHSVVQMHNNVMRMHNLGAA